MDKTTAKVSPRAGKDTDKRPQPLDLVAVVKWAKSNPFVLAVIALASGAGGQEAMGALGQNVQWWMIAAGVGALAVFQHFADQAKRQDRVIIELREIKKQLADGSARFDDLDSRVGKLEAERQAYAEKGKRSDPKLRRHQ